VMVRPSHDLSPSVVVGPLNLHSLFIRSCAAIHINSNSRAQLCLMFVCCLFDQLGAACAFLKSTLPWGWGKNFLAATAQLAFANFVGIPRPQLH
jgi:hypothetical protein